jgi:hypothetical protein
LPDKPTNEKQKTNTKGKMDKPSKLMEHCDTLDQGTNAFMQWLNSEDKKSTKNNPIVVKEFVNNKYSVLYDNNIDQDVIVETKEGVPRCTSCETDDCGHVAFTICLEEKYDNEGTVFD